MLDWSLYPNFQAKEFACHCGCGTEDMDPSLLRDLQELRTAMDFPFIVSSGRRCAAYNNLVSSTGNDGPHTTGRAVDIAMHGEQVFHLLRKMPDRSYFTGIGLLQHGPHHERFVHLDILLPEQTKGPRPWIWTYP